MDRIQHRFLAPYHPNNGSGGLALNLCVERNLLEDARNAQALREIAFEHHCPSREVDLVREVGGVIIRTRGGGHDLTDHFVEGVFFVVVEYDPRGKTNPCEDFLFWIGPLKGARMEFRGKSLHNVGYKTTKRPIFAIHQ